MPLEPLSSGQIPVMVVDDSAVMRGLITRALEEDGTIKVVTSAANGQMAVHEFERNKHIQAIVLDIEMPIMNGIEALPKLLAIDQNIQIIIASTLTEKNAEISLKALQLGAADYLCKPSTGRELASADDFKRDLIQKIKSLAAVTQRQRERASLRAVPKINTPTLPTSHKSEPVVYGKVFDIVLQKKNYLRPDIIAIGSSTGGPQALFVALKGLADKITSQPIVITQHMPATFTTILAQHIKQQTGFETFEVQDNMLLEAGKVYVAQGNHHFTIIRSGTQLRAKLTQTDPVNFCRPAVDVMIRSLIPLYGPKILAVILTGLGADGRDACRELFAVGGQVIAQNEATSVVWGMPGAVAQAGICSAVLPIDQIADAIERIAR
jgi:two-component system, chemotaxis family, protein-glutamate methylesterase/glutaminase